MLSFSANSPSALATGASWLDRALFAQPHAAFIAENMTIPPHTPRDKMVASSLPDMSDNFFLNTRSPLRIIGGDYGS